MRRRTPSRTDFEKYTPLEIIEEFGEEHFILALIKGQEPHDSSRHARRLQKEEKALARREKRRRY